VKEKEYTIRQFAEAFRPPLSRQGILKKVDAGTIPATKPDGYKYIINIDDPKVKEFIKDLDRPFEEKAVKVPAPKPTIKPEPVKVKELKTNKKEKPVKVKKQKPEKKTKSVDLPVIKTNNKIIKSEKKEEPLPLDIIQLLDSGKTLKASEIVGMPKAWVEKIRMYEQTKQITQKRQQERGQLLNKKIIRIAFGKLFEIHVNQFLTIKSKVIPDIAGIFSSTDEVKKLQAEKLIDTELWEILNNIKTDFNKFLIKIGTDAIE